MLAIGLRASSAVADGYCGPEVSQSAFGNPTFWKPEHTYQVVEANGVRALLVEGGVGDNEGAAFAAALAQAGNVDEVWLSSPGGNMAEGMKIGRLIHQKGLAVRIPAGRACISSCSLAFLGGAIRIIEPGGHYGIHMFSVYGKASAGQSQIDRFNALAADMAKKYGREGSAEAYAYALRTIEQRSAVAAAELARYLIEMSASLDFLTGMTGQEHKGVCFVTRPGMKRYNVVNVE